MPSSFQFCRRLRDAAHARRRALPENGRTNHLGFGIPGDRDPLDITPPGPFRPDALSCLVEVEAARLVDGQQITFTVLHCAANSENIEDYEELRPSISFAVTGADGVGAPAREVFFRLSSDTKQFLILQQTCEDATLDYDRLDSNGLPFGNPAGANGFFALVF